MDQLMEFAGNHALLAGGFVAVLALLLWTELTRRVSGTKELTPAQAVKWINDPEAVVVDVSAAPDFNRGHIVDAVNLPPTRLANPDKEVEKLVGKKVLVVCKTGQTAFQAAGTLKKLGVAELAVLKGGMAQWRSDQFPVTSK